MKSIASWLDWTQIMTELLTSINSFAILEDHSTKQEQHAFSKHSASSIKTIVVALLLLILELHSNAILTQKSVVEKSQLMKLSLSSSLTSVTKRMMAKFLWWNGQITTPLSLLALKVMSISINSWNKLGTEY